MLKAIIFCFLFSVLNFKDNLSQFKKFFCISLFTKNEFKIIKDLTDYIKQNKIDFLKNKHITHKYNYLVLENCLSKIKNVDTDEMFIKIQNLISENSILDKNYYLKPEINEIKKLLIPVTEKEQKIINLITDIKKDNVN